MESLDPSKLTDRELLLLVHERQNNMGADVKELKDGTTKELAALISDVKHLGESKADRAEVDRLGRGQARLFNYLWAAFGALAILQIIIPFVLSKYN